MLEWAYSSRRGGRLGLSSLSPAPLVQQPPTATDADSNTENTTATEHTDYADVSEDVRRKDEDVNRRSSLGFRSNFAATRGGSSALLASSRQAAGAGCSDGAAAPLGDRGFGAAQAGHLASIASRRASMPISSSRSSSGVVLDEEEEEGIETILEEEAEDLGGDVKVEIKI